MPRIISQPVVRAETVERVSAESRLTLSYLVFMACSGVLAAVAMLTDSVPILIGSMVVAPVYNPLALVSLAAVTRRWKLALRGLGVALAGLLLAALLALLTTWLFNVTGVLPAEANLLNKQLLEERVHPNWYSAWAALAAGVAGAVAVVKGLQHTLVGVVAALALVPAVAAASIALLSSSPMRVWGGLLLLGINIVVTILAGIVTILLVRPDQKE